MVLVIGFSTTPAPQPAPTAAPVVITAPTVKPRPFAPISRSHRAHPTDRSPRITFFGDSVSWVIGTNLPAHPGMITSVRAIQGCGIATLPDIRMLGTPHTNYPGCTRWQARWQRGVIKDDPDVAVIELNRWELMDRRYQGRYQHVGEPAYDAYLSAQLDRAIDITASRGAAVVLLTAAYTHRAEKPDGSLYPGGPAGPRRLVEPAAARGSRPPPGHRHRPGPQPPGLPPPTIHLDDRQHPGTQRRPALHTGRRAAHHRAVAAPPARSHRHRLTPGTADGAGRPSGPMTDLPPGTHALSALCAR
jgi:hypothetical protein